ncbi:MAG: glycoside hydrolase family 13 protein [Lachnospiraceae bacterium]|nr:glycoside hydrolase family 13 protein [Lachnospiraceae bacterium]
MYSTTKQIIDYTLTVRPLFNGWAVFSDETKDYRRPYEPKAGDEVSIRIRTATENADEVFLVSGRERHLMQRVLQENGFDYFEAALLLENEPRQYHFELTVGDHTVYYGKCGLTAELQGCVPFIICPDYTIPSWLSGAVIYQIYTDRFCNGDPTNDVLEGEYEYLGGPVHKVENWDECPAAFDVRNFYGGDIAGVWQKLDYLKDLGVEVLYLNPIFVSPSNHKYDTQDYEHMDPHIGVMRPEATGARSADEESLAASDQYLADFIAAVHDHGMKVILDGVFNHCGSFNRWLDREGIYKDENGLSDGAYHSEDSPYHTYFKFNDPNGWPENHSYEGWWNLDTLPKLNYEESPELVEHIMKIAARWVSPPYNADGWRLDVAADLGHSAEFNHQFWQQFRQTVREANPNAVVLAEHYGDASSWLRGGEWDTVMNYDAFMEPISYFLTGMEKHSDGYEPGLEGNSHHFFHSMRSHMAAFQGNSLLCAMNELDNHDHSRFLTRTNHMVGRVGSLGSAAAAENIRPVILRQAVVMQMTWPGAPTLYYGDEAGVVGFTDPDNRRTYPWGREDQDLLAFYKKAIALHKERPVLKDGSFVELLSDGPVAVYGRFNRKDAVVTLVNASDEVRDVVVPVWCMGGDRFKDMACTCLLACGEPMPGTPSDENGAAEPVSAEAVYEKATIDGGYLSVTLPPRGACVLGKATV